MIKKLRSTLFVPWRYIAPILCIPVIAGCGYRVLRPGPRSASPVSLYVSPITNRTAYPELDWWTTDAVIMELTTWPWIAVSRSENAGYTLSGEITAYRPHIPYTYDGNNDPFEYKLRVEMSFSLKQQGNSTGEAGDTGGYSRVVPRLEEEEIYRVGTSDMSEIRRAERQALERAIKRLTRRAMDHFMGIGMPCN
ncbi:MAG: LPS assembly lipoprotein LptE [bacterium]